MQAFAQHALPGTILASALGAVVLCVVLLFYGLRTEPDDERSPAARLLLIRVGHALAAACFAAALMLGTVALLARDRARASADDVRRLEVEVSRLQRRLTTAESRLADVEAPRSVMATAVPIEPRRPVIARPAIAHPKKPAGATRVGAPAAPTQMSVDETRPLPPVTSVGSTDDLGARAREDWESVKRGFREAGRDIRSGFVDLGRKIKRTFE